MKIINCLICGEEMFTKGKSNRCSVECRQLFRCPGCGMIQTSRVKCKHCRNEEKTREANLLFRVAKGQPGAS